MGGLLFGVSKKRFTTPPSWRACDSSFDHGGSNSVMHTGVSGIRVSERLILKFFPSSCGYGLMGVSLKTVDFANQLFRQPERIRKSDGDEVAVGDYDKSVSCLIACPYNWPTMSRHSSVSTISGLPSWCWRSSHYLKRHGEDASWLTVPTRGIHNIILH